MPWPIRALIAGAELNFVQISDSHIGFNKAANTNVIGTFQEAIKRINALSKAPEFMLHTGDLSHLAQADEFDTVEQMLKTAKASQVFYVPGEHDILSDNGAQYLDRFGKGTHRDTAGTASTKRASTSSAWSTSSANPSKASAFLGRTNSTG